MLEIPQHVYDDMIEHAQKGAPLEVCGILGGKGGTVSVIYPMTNTDASNEHFMMEPKEQFAVVKDLRTRGLDMLAIYHSHPETPARPSEEDIRLALTPSVSSIIISLENPDKPDMKSFKIHQGEAEPEKIAVISR
ncbi:MAG TPA: M67 family metallopeptidase [Desulfuromonadales bacterium]|nr:M67 family metallopeptidase [Desulfuromonadales bacterium]